MRIRPAEIVGPRDFSIENVLSDNNPAELGVGKLAARIPGEAPALCVELVDLVDAGVEVLISTPIRIQS